MSLSRLALRLAVIEALAPFSLQGSFGLPWPTHAGDRIFDSDLGAAYFSDDPSGRPRITVVTDETKTEGWGSAPDASIDGCERVTLAFEVLVPMREGAGQDAQLVPAGATDAMTEAILDMVEAQIGRCLADARTTALLSPVLSVIESIASTPWRDADSDVRLSARRLEMVCQVMAQGPWPAPGSEGFEALPSPLREVAQALPDESYGASVCVGVAAMLGSPQIFADLNEIRIAANLARAAGDPAPPAPDAAPEPPVGDLGGRVIL